MEPEIDQIELDSLSGDLEILEEDDQRTVYRHVIFLGTKSLNCHDVPEHAQQLVVASASCHK